MTSELEATTNTRLLEYIILFLCLIILLLIILLFVALQNNGNPNDNIDLTGPAIGNIFSNISKGLSR